MSRERFPDGVWPVMLTPFTKNDTVDYPALRRLVDFYIGAGVAGLFAVCQSSELFFLSREERASVSRAVIEYADGRVPVITGGQTATQLAEQLREVASIAETGPEAVVLLTNQFAREDEDDEVWRANVMRLLDRLDPAVTLGLYECPYPYKRVLSPELMRFCAGSGRFAMLKDTCCDAALIEKKLAAAAGTPLKLYNANTATLLASLRAGASGYSGVMANFHPDLYVWLCRHFAQQPERAELLEGLLTMCSYIEKQYYPVNAKYALSLGGIMDTFSRTKNASGMTATFELEVRQLMQLSGAVSERLRSL